VNNTLIEGISYFSILPQPNFIELWGLFSGKTRADGPLIAYPPKICGQPLFKGSGTPVQERRGHNFPCLYDVLPNLWPYSSSMFGQKEPRHDCQPLAAAGRLALKEPLAKNSFIIWCSRLTSRNNSLSHESDNCIPGVNKVKSSCVTIKATNAPSGPCSGSVGRSRPIVITN
jgi:hypothetical protein